jgi:hypothetical protein
MLAGFVIMCDIWIATIFLSGMKQYKAIVSLFGIGYAITVAMALVLRPLGLEGLLGGFVLGQFVLLTGMVVMILRNYPPITSSSSSFFEKRRHLYPTLMGVGFFYNLGVWADKFMFWYYPHQPAVIGPLRASVIYDMPVFLAYLSIIPGMAVFLVKMETDFVEYYDKFYDAVRSGGSLEFIEDMRDEMVFTMRQGIYQIIKIQTIAALICSLPDRGFWSRWAFLAAVPAAAVHQPGGGGLAGGAAGGHQCLLLPRQPLDRAVSHRPVRGAECRFHRRHLVAGTGILRLRHCSSTDHHHHDRLPFSGPGAGVTGIQDVHAAIMAA